ncbi:MAG TPA: hypothetical protein VNO33_14785, partial [Kofleriaceae bacterium]|nr:hypothetical protein [Kofleriaceae bacterium]
SLRDARAEVTRAIIGHSTERMTHHYSHVDEEESARPWRASSRSSGAEKRWRLQRARSSGDPENEKPRR